MIRSSARANPEPNLALAARLAAQLQPTQSLAIPRFLAHTAPRPLHQSRAASQRVGGVSTTGPRQATSSFMMLQESLELALEEADGRVLDETLLLRRANVSPFFTSCKAPLGMPELELASPRLTSRRGSAEPSQALAIPPLNLDLCGPVAGVDGDDAQSLSRAPSWYDFTLHADTSFEPRRRASTFAAVDSFSAFDTAASAPSDAWDAFLHDNGDAASTAPSGVGIPMAFAMKTPTADRTGATSFAFFPDAMAPSVGDPTVLSPTHIDKKVLVTDSDLKLSTSSSAAASLGLRGHRESRDWVSVLGFVPSDDRPSSSSSAARSRTKREKLFPQQAPSVERSVEISPPRRGSRGGGSKHAYADHRANYRYNPMVVTPPSPPTARRTAAGSRFHDEQRALMHHCLCGDTQPALRRLPELPRSLPSYGYAPSPSVFPMVDHQWNRSYEAAQQHLNEQARKVPIPRIRSARERMPTGLLLVQEPELLVFRGRVPGSGRRSRTQCIKPQRAPAKRKIGIYSPEARRERLRRFHEKRKLRVFHKRIKYDCRKRLANSCPRIKGRFVRKTDVAVKQEDAREDRDSGVAVSDESDDVLLLDGDQLFLA